MCGKEQEWVIRGRRIRLCRGTVVSRLAHAVPERVVVYYTIVGGVRFPLKQALARAAGLPRSAFTTEDAFKVMSRLSFPIGGLD